MRPHPAFSRVFPAMANFRSGESNRFGVASRAQHRFVSAFRPSSYAYPAHEPGFAESACITVWSYKIVVNYIFSRRPVILFKSGRCCHKSTAIYDAWIPFIFSHHCTPERDICQYAKAFCAKLSEGTGLQNISLDIIFLFRT